tara:strand:- start:243 stop:515 length:273 start_codon:yes stop_codon:yes gene_type:complete
MDEPYVPKVNDYVIWDKGEYGIEEGWVYFVDDAYITIETGIKPRPDAECEGSLHQFIHTLLVCHAPFWKDLQYVKSRKSAHPQHYSECDN